jgi:hypothetical protein
MPLSLSGVPPPLPPTGSCNTSSASQETRSAVLIEHLMMQKINQQEKTTDNHP